MKLFIVFFLLISTCYAGNITVDGIKYNTTDKYSNKDFTGRKLLDASDLEGAVIYGSCFSQEIPDTKVFPDVNNLTLINDNLDNVVINPGWVIIGGTQKRFIVENDLRDWEITNTVKGIPIKVINEEMWIKEGYSVDVKDIPAQKITDITQIKKTVEVIE